ncbi:MAG: NTP transferase domain-containing protein [Bacteroidales bacterium]|nr:NTP transferase domain-containing protein [Bacteroidales bacterium]
MNQSNNKISKSINYNAIILAAGNSQRMGFPKPFLKWKNNITFLEKIINEYHKFNIDKIIIVINKESLKYYNKNEYKFLEKETIIINEHPEYERFYSVKTGITALDNYNPCFIQNVDNPFINQEVLLRLSENIINDGYVSPVYKGISGHPILIGESIIKHLKKIKDHNHNLKDIISQFKRKNIEIPESTILYNINNLKEYKKFFRI